MQPEPMISTGYGGQGSLNFPLSILALSRVRGYFTFSESWWWHFGKLGRIIEAWNRGFSLGRYRQIKLSGDQKLHRDMSPILINIKKKNL